MTGFLAYTNKTEIKDFSYSAKAMHPDLDKLGDPSNFDNYLPDSGATQHLTPKQDDLYDAVEGQK